MHNKIILIGIILIMIPIFRIESDDPNNTTINDTPNNDPQTKIIYRYIPRILEGIYRISSCCNRCIQDYNFTSESEHNFIVKRLKKVLWLKYLITNH